MTNTEKRLKFEEEVAKELGYVSALFMSQECKGTEIVMPSTELKEVADRIGLYAFTSIAQALAEDRERVVGLIEEIRGMREESNQALDYLQDRIGKDLLSSLEPLTDKE